MTVRDTPWPPGTPCWVDLMTTDPAAARSFYADLFGWDIEVGGEETGGYATATVGGRRVAGIGGLLGMKHPPVWSTYLATENLDATLAATSAAGGAVAVPAMDVLDLGRMAFGQVQGGGVFGCWEAGSHSGVQLANVSNALTWNEFMGRDYAATKAFYASVFG